MVEIPCKTAAGRAELAGGQRRLSQRHRTLLLLVDGRRTLAEVVSMGLQAGVPRGYIDELMALGMVVLTVEGPAGAANRPTGETDLAPMLAALDTQPMPFQDAEDTLGLGVAITDTELAALDLKDVTLAEARNLLLTALRSAGAWTGAVTQLRVRRASDREDLLSLLPEVRSRLCRHEPEAAVDQLIGQVRQLLSWPARS